MRYDKEEGCFHAKGTALGDSRLSGRLFRFGVFRSRIDPILLRKPPAFKKKRLFYAKQMASDRPGWSARHSSRVLCFTFGKLCPAGRRGEAEPDPKTTSRRRRHAEA
jgi:hypothetical protein